jgi:hypothetical protein
MMTMMIINRERGIKFVVLLFKRNVKMIFRQ